MKEQTQLEWQYHAGYSWGMGEQYIRTYRARYNGAEVFREEYKNESDGKGVIYYTNELSAEFSALDELLIAIDKMKADADLDKLINEAAPHWKNIDPAAFMDEVRGRETSDE